jgi:hypothetical protein
MAVCVAKLLQRTMGCALDMVSVDTVPAARAMACSIAATQQQFGQEQHVSAHVLAPFVHQQKRSLSTAWVSSNIVGCWGYRVQPVYAAPPHLSTLTLIRSQQPVH